jgi:hypothetical protein
MARLCRLTWAGGTRSCSLSFAHPDNCAEGDVVRRIPSLVAQERYQTRLAAELAERIPTPFVVPAPPMPPPIQAVTPPVVAEVEEDDDAELVAEPPPVVDPLPPRPDPVTQPLAFLNAHHRMDVGATWRVDGLVLRSSTAVQELPFHNMGRLNTCCGVLNIGTWNAGFNDLDRAAFHSFVQLVRAGFIPTMCIMSTTKYSQTHVIQLLREAGFVETAGYNRSSGNMMSVWILRLYPERI